MQNNTNPIDIVIPWVDGSDPAWQAEKAAYSSGKGDDGVNRYRDWGLLKYLFRGIEKNLPWVRTVHFVTWGHLPEWLDTTCPKLHIVNHKDFIPAQYLPVFSANPIELNLHRIDGLAEHFIYANDDMFFLRPMKREDFFRDGLPVDSAVQVALQIWDPENQPFKHMVLNNLAVVNKHINKKTAIFSNPGKWFSPKYGRDVLKNLYLLPVAHFTGLDDYHLPYPYRKQTFTELWEKEPAVLDATCRNRFRSHYDVTQWLMRYWRLAKGEFVPAKPRKNMNFVIDSSDPAVQHALRDKNRTMICLNDGSPEGDFEKEQAFLEDQFRTLFPEKSAFEK